MEREGEGGRGRDPVERAGGGEREGGRRSDAPKGHRSASVYEGERRAGANDGGAMYALLFLSSEEWKVWKVIPLPLSPLLSVQARGM